MFIYIPLVELINLVCVHIDFLVKDLMIVLFYYICVISISCFDFSLGILELFQGGLHVVSLKAFDSVVGVRMEASASVFCFPFFPVNCTLESILAT